MIYNKKPCYGDGQWHCPFPREWVERMKLAAKRCEKMSAEYIEAAIRGEVMSYTLPPGDFLSEEQDARGLPLSYGDGFGRNVSCDIYDYTSIPDVVISNGHDDWPLRMWESVLTA